MDIAPRLGRQASASTAVLRAICRAAGTMDRDPDGHSNRTARAVAIHIAAGACSGKQRWDSDSTKGRVKPMTINPTDSSTMAPPVVTGGTTGNSGPAHDP